MRDKLSKALIDGDAERTCALTSALIDAGESPSHLLNDVLLPTIRRAGDLWEEGELFIPELMQASTALSGALDIIKPLLPADTGSQSGCTVVIGTIQGDIHDIGKTLVGGMLEASGFSVIDLGADVTPARFIDTARETSARLICVSALLTTTMLNQEQVVKQRNDAGLKNSVAVLVGGAPVTREWADRIGAEGYAPDAFHAVEEASRALEELL